ncbi:serine/threonine-protein kinase [Myxococcota bacterium]
MCGSCRSIVTGEAVFCPHCGMSLAQQQSSQRQPIRSGTQLGLGWGTVVVGDVIGEGGMGIVHCGWLYYNPSGEMGSAEPHPVAVKALHPLLQGRRRARQLFLGEATALSRLSHPNIVHFFALTQHLDQLALVIEYVQGEPLNAVIERHAGQVPRLPFLRAWHYFAQLLGALESIHQLGIIHRDVKPANVLVRSDGLVKLTDFGIARVPAEEARNTGGMAPGTGAYMAPEQVRGQALDGRADLYAAALVLYELVTGVTPFDRPDRNEIQVRAAQLEETAPPITDRVPVAPPVLDLLMARALAKDPMHRFGTALAMGEAFRTALGLADSPGWRAQQELAGQAKRISQFALASPEASQPDASEAGRLRTAVLKAFAG